MAQRGIMWIESLVKVGAELQRSDIKKGNLATRITF